MRLDRTPALLSVVLIAVLGVFGCGADDGETANKPDASTAEVDLGTGYQYREDTLARFQLLIEQEGWSLAEPPRNAQGMIEALHEKTGLRFVLVPEGTFRMGSPDTEEDRREGEDPVHTVRVPAFLLCRTECTQRAWDKVGGEDERYINGPDLPIDEASWDSVKAWCGKAGLRLPSESEWEYACRAGTRTPFSFGRTITPSQVNYNGNFPYGGASKGKNRRQAVAAGSLPSNPWGLFEMHGNVWEWCEDWYVEDYSDAPSDGSARTTKGGSSLRVCRGGSWNLPALYCRSAHRFRGPWSPRWGSSSRVLRLGFRPAADLPCN